MAKAALVTGGAKRIGRRIVERLVQNGYAVAVHCRNFEQEVHNLVNIIRADGGTAMALEADLADADALAGLIDTARFALGPLHLLVNNASLFESDTLADLNDRLWDAHFAVNLRAPVFLARDFARQVTSDETGAVINIVDQRVWRLNPRFFSYTLTKAALWTATQTMAQDLAPRIRVNAIGPGPTLPSSRQNPADFAIQSKTLPLESGPDPDDIAEAVLYLARAKSVTGQMIAVDGGQHLAWQTPDVTDVTE